MYMYVCIPMYTCIHTHMLHTVHIEIRTVEVRRACVCAAMPCDATRMRRSWGATLFVCPFSSASLPAFEKASGRHPIILSSSFSQDDLYNIIFFLAFFV